MKIAIIGTSNSVMQGGYVKALESRHEVHNLSVGRVAVTYHIKTVLGQASMLSECNLVIIDHYINDVNTYLPRVENYRQHTEALYAHLAALGVPVLNVFFPISDLQSRKDAHYLEFITSRSQQYGFSVIDFNIWPFSNESYQDELHLHREVSFALGVYLSEIIPKLAMKQPVPFSKPITEYKTITADQLANKNNLTKTRFSNSLINIDYVKLNGALNIPVPESLEHKPWQAISIGYFNTEDTISCAELVSGSYSFPFCAGGDGYFHELLDHGMIITPQAWIKPGESGKNYPALMGRYACTTPTKNSSAFNVCEILLCRSNDSF